MKTMKKMSTRGASGLSDLLPAVLIFVIVGIGVTIGISIQDTTADTIGTDSCAGYWNPTTNVCQVDATNTTALSGNTAAFNASLDAIEGNTTLASYLPTLALVVAAGIIIAALLGMLYRKA